MSISLCHMSTTTKRKRGVSDGFGSPRNESSLIMVESAESKKSRLDHEPTSPSCVVHVRNVPNDITEHEIAILAIPFGTIKNMVVSRKTCQALIEMDDLNDAVELVSYYELYPVMLHGRAIILQFSTHMRLEMVSENTAIDNAVKNANRIVQQDLANCSTGSPNTVLRVVIDNVMGQQINHLILYKIFHRFGKILRVIIFLRSTQYHCMLEFDDHTHAFVAMLHLNGQNIYTGCCSLHVEFSRTCGPLEVRRETDKCRDYTVTPLTDVELNRLQSLPSGTATFSNATQSTSSAQQMTSGLSGVSELAAQLIMLAQQSGLNLTPQAAAATASFMALTSQGGCISNSSLSSGLSGNSADNHTSMATLTGHNVILPPTMGGLQQNTASSNVLIVSNLNEELVHPDALFTLFGVYGDVTRVKVMFNKKSTALIQFTDGRQALTAMYYLNGQPLWGKPLKISISKFNVVQLPKEDTDVGLTKDYANHPLHRFRKPNSKNFLNIYAPSNTLHLSNIPQDMEEQDVRDLFESKGYPVSGFKAIQFGEKKMALIQLDSVDVAIQALVDLHNIQLADKSHLRISFSKTSI